MCEKCDTQIATTIVLIRKHQDAERELLIAHARHAQAPTSRTQHDVQRWKVETCLANERIADAVGSLPGGDADDSEGGADADEN